MILQPKGPASPPQEEIKTVKSDVESSSEKPRSSIKQSKLDEAKPFTCKFCDRRFKFCSALGGHVSKAHPGLSEAYEHKKRVRDTRQLERDLH